MTTQAPALSQLIDIRTFYSKYSNVVGKATNSNRDGKEWHGSCPRCMGNDRFAFWESGRYSCSIRSSGCGISGSSPYWFLRQVEGLTHRQACEDLGIDLDDYEEYSQQKNTLPLFMTSDQEPCKKWMEAASAFVYRAQRYLWSDKGERALNYLQSRGLSADTIRNAQLGFCPGWYNESLENWGLKTEQTEEELIRIPEGIIIPWFVEGKVWHVKVRRWNGDYFQVLGSSDCLYNTDSMQPGMTVMLLESEIDALSVHQEAGDIIAAVATGGTSKGQTSRWIDLLKQSPGVLIGFDSDEAGENGAASWIKKLPDALRWNCWRHDANELLQQQPLPVRMWVETGLKALHTQIEEPVEETIHADTDKALTFRDLANALDRISRPMEVESVPLSVDPDDYIEKPVKPILIKRQVDPWIKLNDVGLPECCSTVRCRNRAIAWRSNAVMMEAFCEKHIPQKFGW